MFVTRVEVDLLTTQPLGDTKSVGDLARALVGGGAEGSVRVVSQFELKPTGVVNYCKKLGLDCERFGIDSDDITVLDQDYEEHA